MLSGHLFLLHIAMAAAATSIEAPALPYAIDALEPHISKETLQFHHGKHHMAYYNKLVAALPGSKWEGASLEDIVRGSEGAVFNNAAQLWNHSFYWRSMSGTAGGEPTGAIAEAINASFGSFAAFKEQFSAAAAGHFGSGWAWLVQKADGKLEILQTHDAGCPLRDGLKPILTCDVWEHAYYIDFRNDRPAYIKSWWSVVNWEFANANLAA